MYIYIGSDGSPHPKAEAGQGCNSEKTVYNMYIYMYVDGVVCLVYILHWYMYIHIYIYVERFITYVYIRHVYRNVDVFIYLYSSLLKHECKPIYVHIHIYSWGRNCLNLFNQNIYIYTQI